MSGIAEVLLNLGFAVSGSDLRSGPTTERLESLGGKIFIGHDADNISDAEVVVISSAVKSDNPEVVAARYEGIPVIPRAEMLSELMRMKRGIAVAGSHGKTTTTSMIAAVLSASDFDPTAIIGGKLNIFGSNAKMGQGEWMVAEADESDGSFMHLSPTVVVVTNIDREHMEYYKDMDKLHDTFVEFMNAVPFYGTVVACIDDPAVRALIPRVKRRVVSYGLSDDADMRALDVHCPGLGCSFVAVRQGRKLGEVLLDMPGEHNALNALAAISVAFELGVDFSVASKGLHGFTGIGRRFEVKGEVRGATVIDDYAHHPTEIRATLKAARDYMDNAKKGRAGKIVAAFQPHRYSRTKDLWDEFVNAFGQADLLVVTDIYPAGEAPIEGISGKSLCEAISEKRAEKGLPTQYAADLEDVVRIFESEVSIGDLVMTLGAGNIVKAGEDLISAGEKKG